MKKKNFAFIACLASAFVLASCGAQPLTPEELSSAKAGMSQAGATSSAPAASSEAGPSASSEAGPAASSEAGPSASSEAGPAASSEAGPAASSEAGPAASSEADPVVSSSEAEPEASSSVEPVASPYTVVVGETSYPLVLNSAATLYTGQTGEYIASNVVMTKDAVVTFKNDGVAITEHIGADPDGKDTQGVWHHCNLVKSGDDYVVHNDATASIYFKTWTDGYSFWADGYIAGEGEGDEPSTYSFPEGSTPVSWYIRGVIGGAAADWTTGIQLGSNPAKDTDKGCILNLSLVVGDEFKVTDGTTWYGYEKIDTWEDPANKGLTNFQGKNDGNGGKNIECTVAGTYDIYVNSTGVFWIQASA